VAAAAASLVWLVHPWFDAVSDAALYVHTAKALAAGEGYTYLGAPFIARPPGFSVLLAPLVAWRGADFLALNLLVSAFGVLAVALLFAWARPRLGTPLAALVAACAWLNPLWRELCNQTMSDVPGAALLLLCLVLERRAREAPSLRRDAALALSIGLSAYVRAGLLLLVPAILVQRALERFRIRKGATPWPRFARERLLLVAAVPLLVLLPWKVREGLVRPVSPSDQTPLYSYATGLWHADWGDPASPRVPISQVLARVPVRAAETLSALGTRLRASDAALPHRLLGALALALALWVLLRDNRAEGWFLLGTLAVLLVYFDFRTRLALPIHLLVLPAAVEGAERGLRRLLGARARHLVLAALALLVFLDFEPRPGWKVIERKHRTYRELCLELSARVPAESRLAAPLGWHYLAYLDRPVYTLLLGWSRGQARGVEELIERYAIERVVLSSLTDANLSLRSYLVERYGIEQRFRELAIVRVR
jgi:hypothetical protein